MKKFIQENPIEFISSLLGFVIITIGVFISQVDSKFDFVGDVLNFVGSVLASIATTWVFGKEQAKKDLSGKLSLIFGQLTTTVAEIGNATQSGIEQVEQPDISLIRINQSISSLQRIVSEIGKLADSKLNLEIPIFVDTKKHLEEFGRDLNRFKDANINTISTNAKNELNELGMKFNEAIKNLEHATVNRGNNYSPKKNPIEQNLQPDEIILARLRKLDMQYIGKELQIEVIKAIHKELVETQEFRLQSEIVESLMKNHFEKEVKYNLLSKNKIGSILKIFFKAGALEKDKPNELSPIVIKIKENFIELERFINLHNATFFAVADIVGVKKTHVYKILELPPTYLPNEELIKEVHLRLNNPEKLEV